MLRLPKAGVRFDWNNEPAKGVEGVLCLGSNVTVNTVKQVGGCIGSNNPSL